MLADNFLFTWNPDRRKEEPYTYDELLEELIKPFETNGVAQDTWTCKASKLIRIGCKAYMLKQGNPKGIFGRGFVAGNPRVRKGSDGDQRSTIWEVPLKFDSSRGDVLWDPGTSGNDLLLTEAQLLSLEPDRRVWNPQASGHIHLSDKIARLVDELIDETLLTSSHVIPTWVDDEVREVARQKRLTEQLTRPEQRDFRQKIRSIYGDTCAVTGCCTATVLQAAHIVRKRRNGNVIDDNSAVNGILLRVDIHSLFDQFLITLSKDGTEIEVSPEVNRDSGYRFLEKAKVKRPDGANAPSLDNIRHHRERFLERRQRFGNRRK